METLKKSTGSTSGTRTLPLKDFPTRRTLNGEVNGKNRKGKCKELTRDGVGGEVILTGSELQEY